MTAIKNNELLRQFEAVSDSGKMVLEYAIQEKKMFLTKMSLAETENDESVMSFLEYIMQVAQEKKYRVVPSHSKIATYFKKNKKFQELLPPGIKI